MFEYKNGEKSCIGPSKNKGGYGKWNWCCRCTSIWDKTFYQCGECNNRLRFKGRYISRRNKEKKNERSK